MSLLASLLLCASRASSLSFGEITILSFPWVLSEVSISTNYLLLLLPFLFKLLDGLFRELFGSPKKWPPLLHHPRRTTNQNPFPVVYIKITTPRISPTLSSFSQLPTVSVSWVSWLSLFSQHFGSPPTVHSESPYGVPLLYSVLSFHIFFCEPFILAINSPNLSVLLNI